MIVIFKGLDNYFNIANAYNSKNFIGILNILVIFRYLIRV